MTARKRFPVYDPQPAGTDESQLHDTPASAILSERVEWFWINRLPNCNVCLFQGEKESGKSTWLRYFASVISAGGKLPGDRRPRKPAGGVLWYAGEESLTTRVRPGLEAAGANLDRCFLADLHSAEAESMLALPNDCDRLLSRVRYRQAALVVIDPVFSFLDGTCEIDGPSEPARRFVRALQDVACQARCLILLTRNLTKDTSRGALASGRGSGELANACRATLHCQSVAGEVDLYALAVAACNEGPRVPAISYRIVDSKGVQRIEPVGSLSLTADDLVEGDEGDLDRSQLDQAKALIRAMLPSGKLDSKVIKGKAEASMIHCRTIQKAAKLLGVQFSRRGSRDATITYWSPPKGGYPAK
jgi:hypothetical protein